MPPASDPLVAELSALSTCNISDALDRLKLYGTTQGLLPLWPGCGKLAGRAATIRLVDAGAGSPLRDTLMAIGAASPGEVLVIDHHGRIDVNSFGGLSAFTAALRGLRGVVIDGVTRDVDEMRALGFPAYGRGVIQQSIRNRCSFGGHGIEVRIAGVAVRPGDLILADENGTVVLPQARAAELVAIAQEIAGLEEQVKRSIADGMDPVEATERAGYERAAPPTAATPPPRTAASATPAPTPASAPSGPPSEESSHKNGA
jgi:regulator of RNase E activity RraA